MTEARNQGNLVLLTGTGIPNAMNGISTSKQLDFRNVRFNAGVEGLQGCTSVMVIAKRAIWMTHFWEIPGFLNVGVDPNTNQLIPDTETPITDTQFRDRVLNFFRFGGFANSQSFPSLQQSAGPNQVFGINSEILKILVIHPRTSTASGEGDLRYPVQVQQIVSEINGILPNVEPVVIDYVAIDSEQAQHELKHGTVLVQYDPNQKPPGQQDRKAIVKVWVQGDQVEGDITWDPLANQRKRSLFRRQDQGACAEPEEPTTMTTLPSPTPTSVNTPPPPPETENPPPPEPTEALLPPVEPNVFKIRIHQKMEHETSSVEWTLLDSHEQTAAGPDTTSAIPGSSDGDTRSEVQIDVESPTNKDETRITFTMKTDVGGGCMPTWNMARSSGSETSFVAACNPALADAKAYGCDDPKKVEWKPLNAGFERTFMCWWLDVSKVTVGLG